MTCGSEYFIPILDDEDGMENDFKGSEIMVISNINFSLFFKWGYFDSQMLFFIFKILENKNLFV